MNELNKVFDAFMTIYPAIKKVNDKIMFSALIGLLVDQWTADHDMPGDAGNDILNDILRVRNDVYDACGSCEKWD